MSFLMYKGLVKTGVGISTPDLAGDTIHLTPKRQEWLEERHTTYKWDVLESFAAKGEVCR